MAQATTNLQDVKPLIMSSNNPIPDESFDTEISRHQVIESVGQRLIAQKQALTPITVATYHPIEPLPHARMRVAR